jgi:hypothetical protein
MMTRRITALVALLFVLLGVPRASDAGILDFIWEMSGPQMLGFSHGCLYSLKTKKFEQCRLGENPTAKILKDNPNKDERKGPFIGFSAGIYGSTGVDSRTQKYDWWEIGMVELATGFAFRSYETGGQNGDDVQIHHGFGVAYERLFGRSTKNNNGAIHPFNKFAITVTPVDVTLRKVAFGIKLRLYPEGFTDDEFKAGLPPVSDRPFETTVGFTFSWIIHQQ